MLLDARARLIRGGPEDLPTLLAIKRALPMPARPEGRRTRDGGFLLGSDPETYRQLLAVARVWLLEVEGEPAGFSIALDDPVLRASPLWTHRDAIEWAPGFDPTAAVARRIAYFDQLAVLPSLRRRFWGGALALRALGELFDEAGHELVLTTTVVEPIVNLAALPYLARVGARTIGRLEERYPEVGEVVSALHLIEAGGYRACIDALDRRRSRSSRELLAAAVRP